MLLTLVMIDVVITAAERGRGDQTRRC